MLEIMRSPLGGSDLQSEEEVRLLGNDLNSRMEVLDEHAIFSTTDVEGTITAVNDKFCELSGFSREELIGNNHRITKSNEHPPELHAKLWRTISKGNTWHGDFKNVRKNGECYWVRTTIVPTLDERGKPIQYMSVCSDITELIDTKEMLRTNIELMKSQNETLRQEIELHRHTQQILSHAKQEVEYANNGKSDFLAHMSHEFRTPLNAILGYCQLLNLELFGPLGHEKYQGYIDNIIESGSHLHHLIGGVLDLSNIAAGNIPLNDNEFDLCELVASCLTIVHEEAARREVHLQNDISTFRYALRADELHLRNIVLNLLSNAIKFSHKGGTVCANVGYVGDGGIALIISDDGIGITPENIEKVIEPFGQIRRGSEYSFEGSGLGLAVTKSLVELHGGTLSIDSELGKGTVVTVNFPHDRTVQLGH